MQCIKLKQNISSQSFLRNPLTLESSLQFVCKRLASQLFKESLLGNIVWTGNGRSALNPAETSLDSILTPISQPDFLRRHFWLCLVFRKRYIVWNHKFKTQQKGFSPRIPNGIPKNNRVASS